MEFEDQSEAPVNRFGRSTSSAGCSPAARSIAKGRSERLERDSFRDFRGFAPTIWD